MNFFIGFFAAYFEAFFMGKMRLDGAPTIDLEKCKKFVKIFDIRNNNVLHKDRFTWSPKKEQ